MLEPEPGEHEHEDPLSEALIQGILPRPGELEIYLGESGICYRQINAPAPVIAESLELEAAAPEAELETAPGTLLYSF